MSEQLHLATPVKRTARVMQVESMFDVPPSGTSSFMLDLPDELLDIGRSEWNVGLIVGPSGAGKTSIARRLWGDENVIDADQIDWPHSVSVLDAFPPDMGVKDVVGQLTAVGFGSPPAWLRPWHVLSTGERFRASLALALARGRSDAPVVMDEFSSTVDRRVGQIGSAAVAKHVRRTGQRFVAVTCHYDVLDWLQPDWVYRPDTAQLERRECLQRPQLDFDVREVGRDAWTLFRHHHYLSSQLHVAAKCVCAFHDGEPVAFNAYYRFPHPKARNIMVSSRTVVLPDWQGLGLGGRLTEFVGQMLSKQGWRYRATLAHPALIAYRRKSPRWREVTAPNKPSKSAKPKRLIKQHSNPRKLITKTFEYLPER